MSDIKINTRIALGLHPSSLAGMDNYQDGDVQALVHPAVETLEVAYDGIGRIHTAREALLQDRTRNTENVAMELSAFADKHQDKILARFASVIDNYTKGINQLEAQLSAPLAENAEKRSISHAIREHCKALDTEGRFTFLNHAFKSGDTLSLHACLGAPAYLSGMTEQDQSARTRMLHEQQHPELAKRLRVMKDVRERMNEKAGFVVAQVTEAIGSNWEEVRQLREHANKANESLKFAV